MLLTRCLKKIYVSSVGGYFCGVFVFVDDKKFHVYLVVKYISSLTTRTSILYETRLHSHKRAAVRSHEFTRAF